METVDFRSRFSWWLKVFLITGFVLLAVLGISKVGGLLISDAKLLSCEDSLRRLGKALLDYKDRNNNSFPPYITLLYPDYIDDQKVFVCAADRTHGGQGAFPRWMRFTKDGREDPNWREELAYTDLDGPTLIPSYTTEDGKEVIGDKDTFPCSYFYRFNDYPTNIYDLVNVVTWQQRSMKQAREHGDKTPVIRCFWHLPEHASGKDVPTTNLTYRLTQAERYPKEWLPQK